MKFDLIKKADIVTSTDAATMQVYQTLSESLDKDLFSLIEADASFSSKITDRDYKQWIVQTVMDLPRARTTKANFCDAFCNVLENDPAGKVNLGDEELVNTVCNIAWNKYKVIMAEMNLAKQEEDEELVNFIRGSETPQQDNQARFDNIGSEGEPASSSSRMKSQYEETPHGDLGDSEDDLSYKDLTMDQLQDENQQLSQLVQSTRELIDSLKQLKNKEIRSEPQSQPQSEPVKAVEDEEASKVTSKRAQLMKQYDEINAQAQEASRQARLKAAQAKQLDKAISDLDKEVIKQGEHNYNR